RPVLGPGLVNTHTHLELTHLAGRNPEREFSRWIRTIRSLKDATTPEEFDHSAEQGVRDCWTAGVTCVADTGSTGAPLRALARLGARGIYYQEVFGPDPAERAARLAGAVSVATWRLGTCHGVAEHPLRPSGRAGPRHSATGTGGAGSLSPLQPRPPARHGAPGGIPGRRHPSRARHRLGGERGRCQS